MEWARNQYNTQYERWVPWFEDIYLRYFTSDNKASYTAKENLDKTKVTGISQVDTLQDGVNNLAAGQLGQGGVLKPVGDSVSGEGISRAERQGKDDKGGYVPESAAGGDSVVGGVAEGGKKVAGVAQTGVQSVGGVLGL